jgi:drug/metabolite transporter (DMT)-like permease
MLHTLLYFLALFSLSTSSTLAKVNHMPVEVLGFWRLSIAAGMLGVWLISKRIFTTPRPETGSPVRSRQRSWGWIFLAGFFFFLHLATYKYAAKNTTISNTMILFASNPIWASIGAALFFQERITRRLVLAYVISLIGIYILMHKQIQFSPEGVQGDISALLSALFYSLYMLAGKKARLQVKNTVFSFFQYAICAAFFGITVLALHANFTGYESSSWLAVLGLVLLPTFLGHFSMTYLVKFMDINIMSCGKLLEPVFAAVIAYFVFSETLQLEAWIAFILTSISILILFEPGLRRRLQKI